MEEGLERLWKIENREKDFCINCMLEKIEMVIVMFVCIEGEGRIISFNMN